MITNPVPPDETVRRHLITPEETEEHIQVCEKLPETASVDQARLLRDLIDILKAQVVRMRAGTFKDMAPHTPQKFSRSDRCKMVMPVVGVIDFSPATGRFQFPATRDQARETLMKASKPAILGVETVPATSLTLFGYGKTMISPTIPKSSCSAHT
jgi:hypothetical protein